MSRSRRLPVYWVVSASNHSRKSDKQSYHRVFRRISRARILVGDEPLRRWEEVSDWTWDIKEGRMWPECRCGADTWWEQAYGDGKCYMCAVGFAKHSRK